MGYNRWGNCHKNTNRFFEWSVPAVVCVGNTKCLQAGQSLAMPADDGSFSKKRRNYPLFSLPPFRSVTPGTEGKSPPKPPYVKTWS